jgi:acetyl-CoA C-acetyltransferase
MGMTAENLAERYNIPREEQDELAYTSHMRACKAIQDGTFKDEIVPVPVAQKRGEAKLIDTDEGPRADTTVERLSRLPPVFKKGGTVTAGNSSSMNDASAGVLVTTAGTAREMGITPMARIVSYAMAGVDPDIMGIGPVPSSRAALDKAGCKLVDIGLIEINEAFAAQFLAVDRELHLNRNITNVHGSGISLGHPIGATGCRLTVTLLHEMARRGVDLGLVSLCGGGGIGLAMVLEQVAA